MKTFILIDKRVMPAELMQWARWMELSRADNSFRVAETMVGDLWVSTVFLGLDHRFVGDGPPIVFETMVFSGEHGYDENMARYCTYDEALDGHNTLVASLRMLHEDSIEITRATLGIMRAGLQATVRKDEK